MTDEVFVDLRVDISMIAGIDGNAVEVVGLVSGRLECWSFNSWYDVGCWRFGGLAGGQGARDQQHENRNQSVHILSLIAADDIERQCTRVKGTVTLIRRLTARPK